MSYYRKIKNGKLINVREEIDDLFTSIDLNYAKSKTSI